MSSSNKKIFVTEPLLPELDKFLPYLQDVWDSKWLTNNGNYHQALERRLSEFLGITKCSLCCNGTMALMLGLKQLNITGEVITTPYSFPATAHSLTWLGIEPVFCDIELDSFNINPDLIPPLISSKTSAILGVHVYGNPCKIDAIESIANEYGLKVIYDAAHAFGVRYNNESILVNGDLSILSFHATKVFNTFEGGAIVMNDDVAKKEIDLLKNFGFDDETTILLPGINGKMNEIQAAFGLLQLLYVDEEIKCRSRVYYHYLERLINLTGIQLFEYNNELIPNYSYFPILIDEKIYGLSRDHIYDKLKSKGIYARRYFFPLISKLPHYLGLSSAQPDYLPVSEKVSKEVLCLPIYGNLSELEIDMVCDILINKAD